MNFVAINLAHDILSGNRTVAEARQEYTRLYKAHKDGEKPAYTQSFQFDLPKGDTRDPDTEILRSILIKLDHLGKKRKKPRPVSAGASLFFTHCY